MEALYSGHVGTVLLSVLIQDGVLISGCTLLYVAGTMRSILIKGDVLISGVSL